MSSWLRLGSACGLSLSLSLSLAIPVHSLSRSLRICLAQVRNARSGAWDERGVSPSRKFVFDEQGRVVILHYAGCWSFAVGVSAKPG